MLEITPLETFLQDFHEKHPGCTSASLSDGRTSDGRSSYDVLASVLGGKNGPVTVIDLACGDGILLQKISHSERSGLTLVGIDMSAGELEAARSRLGASSVRFIQGNARALPIVDASADFVLCHMALMVMDCVDQVVTEIHRALKSGGCFSAIVEGKYDKNPYVETFVGLVDVALRDEGLSWFSNFGDERTRSEEGLRSLFDAGRFAAPVEIKNFSLHFSERPADLVDLFMLMYVVDQLSPKRRERLAADLLASLLPCVDEDGKIQLTVPMRQLTCRKP